MIGKFIIGLLIIVFFISCLYGESSIEYEKRIENEVTIIDVQREFNFSYTDSRKFQENKIDISNLLSEFDLKNNTDTNALCIDPINIEFDFSYFGFYKTSSGTWIAKSVIHCKINDHYNPSHKEIKTFSSEIVCKRKRKLKQSLFNKWSYELIKDVKLAISDYLKDYTNLANDKYRNVTSFGKQKISGSDEETLELAKLEALKQGCVNAWGLQLESTTTLIDLADVEEKTSTTSKGLIIVYKVLDKYTKKTDDDFLCILVQSIILNPYKQ